MDHALAIFRSALRQPERTAVVDSTGRYSYAQLWDASARIASQLLAGAPDLGEQRVAFSIAPGFDYAATQWGIWRAGGVAVPLGMNHPLPELQFVLADTQASAVVVDAGSSGRLRELIHARGLRLLDVATRASETTALPALDKGRRAMILYTSGTTSKPKGVVTTHENIQAQVQSLIEAWRWSPDDRILHVLPLHHIHGIVNVLGCALAAGAA